MTLRIFKASSGFPISYSPILAAPLVFAMRHASIRIVVVFLAPLSQRNLKDFPLAYAQGQTLNRREFTECPREVFYFNHVLPSSLLISLRFYARSLNPTLCKDRNSDSVFIVKPSCHLPLVEGSFSLLDSPAKDLLIKRYCPPWVPAGSSKNTTLPRGITIIPTAFCESFATLLISRDCRELYVS
jgi:hypothetical protein